MSAKIGEFRERSNKILPQLSDPCAHDAEYCETRRLSDITYIPTREGWLYLAAILACIRAGGGLGVSRAFPSLQIARGRSTAMFNAFIASRRSSVLLIEVAA